MVLEWLRFEGGEVERGSLFVHAFVCVCLCLEHLSRSESMMDYSNKYNLLYIYIFLINLRKPRRTSPSASAIVFPFSLTMFSAISF